MGISSDMKLVVGGVAVLYLLGKTGAAASVGRGTGKIAAEVAYGATKGIVYGASAAGSELFSFPNRLLLEKTCNLPYLKNQPHCRTEYGFI